MFGFLGFASLSALLSVAWLIERATIEPNRLGYRTLVGRGEMFWHEITHVGYGRFIDWFVMRTSEGRIARISTSMINMPSFARMVLRHVPVECIDKNALAALELAARV